MVPYQADSVKRANHMTQEAPLTILIDLTRDGPERSGTHSRFIGRITAGQDVEIRFLPAKKLKIFPLREPPAITQDDHSGIDIRGQLCFLMNHPAYCLDCNPITILNLLLGSCLRMEENKGIGGMVSEG